MSMELMQVRLPEKMIFEVKRFVNKGLYASKSDLIRDAIRKLILEKQVGSINNTGDSVQEIKAIRKKLSNKDLDIEAINTL